MPNNNLIYVLKFYFFKGFFGGYIIYVNNMYQQNSKNNTNIKKSNDQSIFSVPFIW